MLFTKSKTFSTLLHSVTDVAAILTEKDKVLRAFLMVEVE